MNLEEEKAIRLDKARLLKEEASKLLFSAKVLEAEAKKFDKLINQANELINANG